MSLVVPVFAATGRPSARARCPVPLVTTLSMRLVMMKEVSGETTCIGASGDNGTGGGSSSSAVRMTAEVTGANTGTCGGTISSRTVPSPSTTFVMKKGESLYPPEAKVE